VAVKKFLPSTVHADVYREAGVLVHFCHPYLPMLFGVVTSTLPYRIIMQYHGLSNRASTLSVTLNDILIKSETYDQNTILLLCAQLTETVHYLHEDVKILHNDLKCNNVLICDKFTGKDSTSNQPVCNVQILLIDFGKATSVDNGRKYKLNDVEKLQYIKYYPHLASEVVQGFSSQSKLSDIYSLGVIFHKIFDHGAIKYTTSNIIKKMDDLAAKCRSPHSFCRPNAKKISEAIKKMLDL